MAQNTNNNSKLPAGNLENIADLRTKFDKFNQPKNVKFGKELGVAQILKSITEDKIQELKSKFQQLTLSKKKVEIREHDFPISDIEKNKKLNTKEERRIRGSTAESTLQRDISTVDRYRRLNVGKKLQFIEHEHVIEKTVSKTKYENYFKDYRAPPVESFIEDHHSTFTHENIDLIFQKIERNKTTFTIWRIEEMTIIPVPKEHYGTFYKNEAYIIYAASNFGQPCGTNVITREISGCPEYHIHFWLGSETSTDNAGVAAYKAIELDIYLGGNTTQHRETQGNESGRFLSYFPKGIIVFNSKVDDEDRATYDPDLYQLKGIRSFYLLQMSQVKWSVFNSGDIFFLHTKRGLFLWTGQAVDQNRKMISIKAATYLRDMLSIPHIIFLEDGYERTLFNEERLEWEKYLSLQKRNVKTIDEIQKANAVERTFRKILKLYKCCDLNGKYRVTEIKTGPLHQTDLLSNNVMILDHNIHGIWIWVGRDVGIKEKTEAIRNARGFVKKKKYPNNTPVIRVVEGIEPLEFKNLFINWIDFNIPTKNHTGKQKLVLKVTRFDAITMHERPALAAKSQLLDDGSGTLKIWRIKQMDVIEIPAERYGVFFTGDCYVVAYNYHTVSESKWILYYWMGYHSIPEEQGVAAIKLIELDTTTVENGGVYCRVTQGREPIHFLQLFKGKLQVFNGFGTDYDLSGRNMKTPHHYLLCIQGSCTFNTRATQMPLKASSLNSNYCFVLRKGNIYYIWCGKKSTGDNREMAKGFVGLDFVLLREGNETPEFWAAICGEQAISNKILPDLIEPITSPALYRCTMPILNFKTDQLLHFTQEDLVPEDVMILDVHNTIYIWIGSLSPAEEQILSFEIGLEYLKSDPRERDLGTTIIQIKQHFEPPTFTGFFESWNNNLWMDYKNYSECRNEIEGQISRVLTKSSSSCVDIAFDRYNKYSFDVLRKSTDDLPNSVDPLKKELHLTHDDFLSIFCMEYNEFEKLPLWKQQEMKKHVGLF